MSVLKKIVVLLLALCLITIAGILEVDLKYGKQMREESAKMNTLAQGIERLNKINSNLPIDMSNLAAAMEGQQQKAMRVYVQDMEDGLVKALKGPTSVEGYFILIDRKAFDLKKNLQYFKDIANTNLPGNAFFKKGTLLDLQDVKADGKIIAWENYYFGNATKEQAIGNLELIKETMVLYENEQRKKQVENK